MFKAVAFDFNGTLIDDHGLWCDSIRAVCRASPGAVSIPDDQRILTEILRIQDGEWSPMYKRLGVSLSPQRIWETYHTHYMENVAQCGLYPDVLGVLKVLKGRNVHLSIITANSRRSVAPLLKPLGLTKYMDAVFFSVGDKAHCLRLIMRGVGVNPEEMCMVGDTQADVRHAREAGCFPFAMVRGHFECAAVLAHPEDYPIHTLPEILKFFT